MQVNKLCDHIVCNSTFSLEMRHYDCRETQVYQFFLNHDFDLTFWIWVNWYMHFQILYFFLRFFFLTIYHPFSLFFVQLSYLDVHFVKITHNFFQDY